MGARVAGWRNRGVTPGGIQVAWRSVTVVSAASIAVAVTAGIAAAFPDSNALGWNLARGVTSAAAGCLMAVGTFRTMRWALYLGGVPTDEPFVPDGAPRSLSELGERLVRSRRVVGAMAMALGLLLGLLGAHMSVDGEAPDDRFAELPRHGFENASDEEPVGDASGWGSHSGWESWNGSGAADARTGTGVDDLTRGGASGDDRSGRRNGGGGGGGDDGDDDDGGNGCTGSQCGGTGGGGGTNVDDDLCEVVDHTEDQLGTVGGTLDSTSDDLCDDADELTDEACRLLGQEQCDTLDTTVTTVDDTLDDTVDEAENLLGGLLDGLSTSSSTTTTTTTSLLGGLL